MVQFQVHLCPKDMKDVLDTKLKETQKIIQLVGEPKTTVFHR